MEFIAYKRVSEDGVTAFREDGSAKFIEPSHPEWDAVKDAAGPYTPPPEPTPEELLAQERARMSCRAAAMRLVLHRMALLDQVQAITDSDSEASIVWEYEPIYKRNDPFVEALGVEAFTPEQIDDLFREAMKL